MKTENDTLAQQSNFSKAAAVSPGGRRPEGETAAEAPQHDIKSIPDVQVKAGQKAPRRNFSAAYKLQVLEAYDACENALARGALLRKEGLYYSRISTWRKLRDDGKLDKNAQKKTPKTILVQQQLTRENAQLKKKLAQAEAIIELQKKVSDLFGTHILPLQNNELS